MSPKLMKLGFSLFFLFISRVIFCQSSTDSITIFTADTANKTQANIDTGTIIAAIDSAVYPRRKSFAFITNVPADLWQIAKSPVQKKNLPWFIATAAATALLIPFDQNITDGTKHFFRQVGIDPNTDYSVPIHIGKTKLLKVPNNLTSAFYMLGEGSISMSIAGGLYVFGKIGKNQRAVNTAADLSETFFTMGITTQVLKRISGRQSPFMATSPGGRWRPFPSFKEYQVNTSNYDAFPSGHLATMMATVTTLALNYPNNKWIKPIGYSLMSLTGLAMINTDVHWVGDYPLALALGYISAKITYLRNHPAPKKPIYL